MKIGIGIDTGGSCTDAVIYQFENKEFLRIAPHQTVTMEMFRMS